MSKSGGINYGQPPFGHRAPIYDRRSGHCCDITIHKRACRLLRSLRALLEFPLDSAISKIGCAWKSFRPAWADISFSARVAGIAF